MKPMSSMNVIPFIDIMLVLLAVVLTTATFVAQGRIPVSLPGATTAEPLDPTARIEITISRDGRLALADRELDRAELAEQIRGSDRRTAVLLRVDEEAAFNHFVAIVDMLKLQGMNNVSILTRRVGN
jgi:biopolymer transport protein ExbD